MTRKKTGFLDKLKRGLSSIDSIFVDRSEVNNCTKIQQLEEQMNKINCFDDFKNNFASINKISNKKMNLKNSKRF
ncbi:MAG: hypothetical protein K5798_02670 [Nitrosopumilus sp.]|uniref:hypothetical protein n=1 Tax=Nitrosopumilus sp. TaxID=2024843 RepID=UPI002431C919|nr:hypothetical protein [Nitrosopumilus sp.]MCV0366153.1 hypothetical protein [Nitrosopumilus sp.]